MIAPGQGQTLLSCRVASNDLKGNQISRPKSALNGVWRMCKGRANSLEATAAAL